MELEKREYVHIKMSMQEAIDLTNIVEHLYSTTNNSPDWVKKKAKEIVQRLESVGL